MIKKILKRLYCLVYCLLKINWVSFFKNVDKKSNVVLWIPAYGLKYWGGDSFVWDMATINALVKKGKLNVIFGNKIGKISNKNIFFTVHEHYNLFQFQNYVSIFDHISKQLINQDNILFPKKNEVEFWENKILMHEEFDNHKINTPLTKYASSIKDVNKLNWEYPFLIKEPHSCSANGIYKINSQSELINLIDNKFLMRSKKFIVQKLINMRRDLRVIILKDKIVHYYWRINKDTDWKPTSTGHGSMVDFGNFPKKWEDDMIKTLNKLDLTIGGFDVAWDNDDLEGKPIYLEVSPVFQPNPVVDEKFNGSYGKYKKGINLFNSWDKKYVNIIFEIKKQYVNKTI